MTINSRLPTAGYQDIPLQKKVYRNHTQSSNNKDRDRTGDPRLRTFRATAGRNLVLLLDVPSLAKTCTELPPSLSLPATSGRAARAASERGVVVRRRYIKMTNV